MKGTSAIKIGNLSCFDVSNDDNLYLPWRKADIRRETEDKFLDSETSRW